MSGHHQVGNVVGRSVGSLCVADHVRQSAADEKLAVDFALAAADRGEKRTLVCVLLESRRCPFVSLALALGEQRKEHSFAIWPVRE